MTKGRRRCPAAGATSEGAGFGIGGSTADGPAVATGLAAISLATSHGIIVDRRGDYDGYIDKGAVVGGTGGHLVCVFNKE